MNWVDIAIIICLGISIISGFMQGLIRTVLSIVGLIAGIILASRFYVQLGNVMTFISNKNVAHIVAFILILLVVMGIAAIIAAILRKLIRAIMLGWVDRLGGAVIGLILGALTISALLAIIMKYNTPSMITNSKLAGFFLNKFPLVLKFMPSDFGNISKFFK